jgi:7-cyano-7-deazaguanine synthase
MPKPTKESAVLLASGGLDSTTLAYWLAEKNLPFSPLFIDYGQHCRQTELETLMRVLPTNVRAQVEIVRIADIYKGCRSRLIAAPDLWSDDVTGDDLYLPYRNLLMLSVGAAFAQARGHARLYSAFINSNHAKEIDCSAEFFEQLGTMLSDYGTVRIEMPFRNLTKTEVAAIGLRLGAPIAETYSCQAATTVPCGACPNCVDRAKALLAIQEGNIRIKTHVQRQRE